MSGGMRRNGLLRAQDDREVKRRNEELQRGALQKYTSDDVMLHGNYRYDDRAEHVRREREARQRAQEEQKLDQLYTAHKQREYGQQQAQEDAKIASHLERTRKESERQQRVVQRIRNESEELRALSEKLRAAEMNLERTNQLKERKMLQSREKEYNASYDNLMENERLKKVAAEEAKQVQRRQDQIGARLVQEEQVAEKKEMQRAAMKEFERERAAVDEIVGRIQEEDTAEMKRKAAKQEETKRWVEKFLVEREVERNDARRKEQEEEARIKAYGNEVERRRMDAAAKAKSKADDQARVLDKLTRTKEEEMRKAEEMEDLINRLHYEEQEQKFRAQERAKVDKQQKSRLEMMQANDYQKQLKAQRRQKEAEEEEEYRRRMMEKYSEDERIDQENKMRRESNMRDFKKEVEHLAEHKQGLFEAQQRQEIAEQLHRDEEDQQRSDIIEQERKRMLAEHAAKLIDYLPKGVLQKPEDLEMLIEMLSKKMEA
ncbi:hypothetical protein CYMTET_40173 [Cymbomonas tetramitiformis]|uniref:Meiosis-specific nuclear structural protein 1 n=1 Tax=Cymbomonas tetramitiformis TaxID=36881 RepID=A0AAE0C9U2_9CHLO|nr:hypothetical protein CYMTET_40173 [Cymbomonas tetramitiformis]